MAALAMLLHVVPPTSAQSRSSAEMPDAILKAQTSRPAPNVGSPWISEIRPGAFQVLAGV
jgi:hypothetical protein